MAKIFIILDQGKIMDHLKKFLENLQKYEPMWFNL